MSIPIIGAKTPEPNNTIPQLVPLAPHPVGYSVQVPQPGLILLVLSTPVGTSIHPFADADMPALIEALQAGHTRSKLLLESN